MTYEQMVALLRSVPVNRVYEALTIAPKLETQTDRDRAGWRASREPNMFVFQHYTSREECDCGVICVLAPETQREGFYPDLNRVAISAPGGGHVALLMAEQFSVDD
jgi:hypothetical protein